MRRDIECFKKNSYDVLVIGGGINGAAIAHLAARHHLRVALIEKGDFASGTSGKSTKLIHGGIRYLENFEFDLVYESLHERSIQLQAAPHLVKPLEFMIPVYRGDARPLWMMQAGVFLYNLLAGSKKLGNHIRLSAREIIQQEPHLKSEGLKGGVTYCDAQMDDARLCLENVLAADQHGADVANYVDVISFMKENGRVVGVKATDQLMDHSFEVRAQKIVCAVGPWTNEMLRLDDPYAKKKVRTTKGIHIVYQDQISNHALLVTSKRDDRVFFVIPWMGNSLIGTTDTNYIGRPDDVEAKGEDVDYLLEETRRLFPNVSIHEDKIVSVFAGLRPLVRKGGHPSKVSRKHVFFETESGIFFVMGGKYTTYRKIAAECLKRIDPAYRPEKDFQIYGSGLIRESPDEVAAEYGLGTESIYALRGYYGSRYLDVLKRVEGRPHLKEKIWDHPPIIMAQVDYAIQVEMAQTIDDIVLRRLPLGYVDDEKARKKAETIERVWSFLERG